MLPDIPVVRLSLRWDAGRPVPVPLGIGEALRGAVGHALAAVDAGAFALLYGHEGTAPWSWRYRPEVETVQVGVQVVLFGPAIEHARALVEAAQMLPTLHVTRGPHLPPMRLLHASSSSAEPLPLACAAAFQASGWMTLTPVLLLSQGRLIEESPEYANLRAAIVRRLQGLAKGCDIVWDPPAIGISVRLKGLSLARFPAKSASLPGWAGTVSDREVPPEDRPLLAAACVANAGRHAVYGAGAWAPLARVG